MMKQEEKRQPNKNWFMKKEKPTRAEMKPWGDLLHDKIEEIENNKISVDDLPF